MYFPLADQTGFLVVSSKSTASADALRGSMAIVDRATGLVVSYAGIDNAADTSTGAAGKEGDFSGITDLKFPLTFLPGALVTTSWFGVAVGDMGPAIAVGANWGPGISFANGGQVFNNEEVPFSGAAVKAFNCSGSFAPADLMTSAQAAAIGSNGGLIKASGTVLPSVFPAQGAATGAVLMKMQAVQPAVGGAFGGKQFLHREQAGL